MYCIFRNNITLSIDIDDPQLWLAIRYSDTVIEGKLIKHRYTIYNKEQLGLSNLNNDKFCQAIERLIFE